MALYIYNCNAFVSLTDTYLILIVQFGTVTYYRIYASCDVEKLKCPERIYIAS